MFKKPATLIVLIVTLLLAVAIVPVALVGDAACDTRVNNTFGKLLECVTLGGVREWALAGVR